MKTDFLIVGQGIAGTTLALTFQKLNIPFKIIDNSPISSSSLVAAGLYNPVVFKRLTHSWRAPELIPFMNDFFNNWELENDLKIHFQRPILKLLANKDERDFWIKKSNEDHLKQFISADIINDFHSDIIKNESGLGKVLISGNVLIPEYLNISRDQFIDDFIEHDFNWENVQINEVINYLDNDLEIETKNLIVCDGWLGTKNPFFSYLPFNLAKGEILKIKIENYNTESVVNKRAFILPLGNNEFRVGSTYQWTFEDDTPSEVEKAFLVEKLEHILKLDYQILEHTAGIRPATKDRRPFLGTHPVHKNIHIFNGFGSKGIMMAPLLAHEFVEYLTNGESIHKESNIKRFNN